MSVATRKRILKDVPTLRFGEGRDCTLPACVAVATGQEYDWVMGASGAAFTTTIDVDGWDPLAAAPLDDETLARAARATGTRPDALTPPYDAEMKDLVIDRILESLESKVPPLARGLVGPAEYGLLVGCDDEGPTFYARTYFDKTEQPTKLDWKAIDAAAELVFLDRGAAPDRAKVARDAVEGAVATAETSDRAFEAWIVALRDDTRWTDSRHTGAAAFGDHAMRTLLADKRRAAASFLRTTRALFPGSPGADLLRSAESYGYVADAAKKVGIGPFDASVAMRFLDAGHRRAWAKQLEAALGHERDAHDALRAARAGMR
ncbi:MAG TPA: hypothetical protein VGS01_16200 [Candidatus Limnocylindria bacterium]|nr:hypothetical protein [Candidatus Limnocylindria bacterium]